MTLRLVKSSAAMKLTCHAVGIQINIDSFPLRSSDAHFDLGFRVILLYPELGAKVYGGIKGTFPRPKSPTTSHTQCAKSQEAHCSLVLPNELLAEEGDFCSNKSLLARRVPRIGRANQLRESEYGFPEATSSSHPTTLCVGTAFIHFENY